MKLSESNIEFLLRWYSYRKWNNVPSRNAAFEFRQYVRRAPSNALALDMGANVGDATALFLKEGFRVIAFEPDKLSLAQLRRRFDSDDRVTIVPKAIGAASRRTPLYRTQKNGEPDLETTSFLHLPHHHAEPVDHVDVLGVADLFATLHEPVYVMKVDIEGAEVELLNALMDHGLIGKIGRIFVETHERLDKGLAAATQRLRARLTEEGITNVNLDWP